MVRRKIVTVALIAVPVIALAFAGCQTAERADWEVGGNRGYLLGGPPVMEDTVRVEETVAAEEITGESAGEQVLTVARASGDREAVDREATGNRGYLFGGPPAEESETEVEAAVEAADLPVENEVPAVAEVPAEEIPEAAEPPESETADAGIEPAETGTARVEVETEATEQVQAETEPVETDVELAASEEVQAVEETAAGIVESENPGPA